MYLPEKQMTLVILINTDIPYQGSEPSTTLATAITNVLSPEHVYTIGEGRSGQARRRHPRPRQSADDLSYSVGLSAKQAWRAALEYVPE